MANNNVKKLYRSNTDRIIFGVCGGLGEYFGVDSLLLRIIFIFLTFFGGSGILIYLILAILMPKEPETSGAGKTAAAEEAKIRVQNRQSTFGDIRNFIGVVIILIGLLLLTRTAFNYQFFSWIDWGIVWAVVIIAIGFRILFSSKR
ncbi:MAG: PspC domain-containing protein [Candidatus Pacebacteria bacterium]|nr:PspC domain-containing protein [Candidatus Paceibacterota bacterium]